MDTKTLHKKTATPSATCAVSPEDLRRGDYVAVMHTTEQFVVLNDKAWGGELKALSIKLFPYDAGQAYRVRAVCLPFVFVRVADGGHQMLDLRRQHVRRLDKAFGKLAFHAQRDKNADKSADNGKTSRGKKRKRKGKKKDK